MRWVQGWVLATCLAAGEAAPVGDAGLAALAEARAGVRAVAGTGMRTVRRNDQPDEPGDPRRLTFAVTSDGRYEVVLTDPKDPDERTRFVCDGATAWEASVMMADEQPLWKQHPAAEDLLTRMLACLRLDLVQLRRDYAVSLDAATDGQRKLRLVATDPAVKAEVSEVIVFLDPAGRPVRVILDEASGNQQILAISSFADDPQIDPARFVGRR